MRAIDTGVLVRLLTRDDPRQVAAAEAYVEAGAWVSLVVLVEAAWVLESVYGAAPRGIATAVEMLLDHQTLVVQEPELVSAAVAEYRRRPTLGFSDCIVLESARKAGHLPLGTFDRKLGSQPDAKKL